MKLAIATPVYGAPEVAQLHLAHVNGLLSLIRSGATYFERLAGVHDLVRARSRAVAMFLAGDYTHLLFWDADVGGPDSVNVLGRMIEENVDFIAAPYPKKKRRNGKTSPTHQANGWVGLGFTLLTRSCLERMTEHYRPELEFNDHYDDVDHPTVALFMLMFHRPSARLPSTSGLPTIGSLPVLLGEDYSFCQRWLDMGGKVWLYNGPGVPLQHVGGHVYQ